MKKQLRNNKKASQLLPTTKRLQECGTLLYHLFRL
nr:MAG TPA: hypothetical protein [Caudoviricetes sp.]